VDAGAVRAGQRQLVRRGYDAISLTYRDDDGRAATSSAEDVSRYHGWAAELAALLGRPARVVDLGCGAGIPATRALTGHGLQVLGVDFSAVQLARARRLVPQASFVQVDMAALHLRAGSVDAVVSFYALIHVPRADQRALFGRIRAWLRPGGYFLAIVGAEDWTGVEHYLGADMFWDHADTGLDLCLHVVRRDHGAAVAAATARTCVMPLERAGGQAQFITHEPSAPAGGGLQPLLAWLTDNLHRPLTLTQIAAHASMSTRSLSRHFRDQTGTTPIQWLNRHRIRHAQELLQATDQPIELIGHQVGFTSPTAFRDRFRQVVGVNPRDYRSAFPPAARSS
jgi:AraC-like DNA-binding protein